MAACPRTECTTPSRTCASGPFTVTVYGSPDRIRPLRDGQLPAGLVAVLNISNADVAAGKGSRKLEYMLPEGVTIRDDDKQPVTFEITPAATQ